MKLYAPSTIKEIKRRHDFELSKSLGQNFLTDMGIVEDIVCGTNATQDDLVIEIGPGIGVLTAELAKRAAKVIAIEIDKKLIPILDETLAEYSNVEIINADVLKTNINEIINQNREQKQFTGEVHIVGNLPYYITTPIIMGILENNVAATSITIMMQKEVADRIKSDPGNKTYGAISVAVQYYCEVREIAKVSKEVFIPRPKVDSTVLGLKVREERLVNLDDEKTFFACVKAGFGQRRKTLLNALTGVYSLSKEEIKNILEEVEIDPIRRAETLKMEEFANIANKVYEKTKIK